VKVRRERGEEHQVIQQRIHPGLVQRRPAPALLAPSVAPNCSTAPEGRTAANRAAVDGRAWPVMSLDAAVARSSSGLSVAMRK
jgi:hypothetical protein